MTTPRFPVIVAGMHRSGTSLVASYLSALGVDMGDELIPAAPANPHGYFEDARFVELDGRILESCTPEGDGGHRDWGWTESEQLDRGRFAEFHDDARAVVAERVTDNGCCPGGAQNPYWGWKDPRTSLLLDLWEEIVPEARYVLLYRFPWDVADSMQRLGADVFLKRPDYAFKIWSFYNRHLLDFYHRHADRAVLVSSNAFVTDPDRFAALLRDKLDLELDDVPLGEVLDCERFVTLGGDDPLISLTAATSPECVEWLGRLDDAADLPADGLWTPPAEPLRCGAVPGDGDVDLSVVIPCFDDGEYLAEAIASVERLVDVTWELIVVNDGSSDPRTLEIFDVLREAGYRVVDQEHSGLSAARNRGFEAARGRYVLPLDSDNCLRPDFPAMALEILDGDPEIGGVYGDRWEFGNRSGRQEQPEIRLEELLWGNYVEATAVLRKELWQDVGGYDTALPAWEDWEFWLHVVRRGWRLHRLDEVTHDYRVRPHSLVEVTTRPEVVEKIVAHVLEKHRELYQESFNERIGAMVHWPLRLEREVAEAQGEREAINAKLARTSLKLADVERLGAETRQQQEALSAELTAVQEQLSEAESRSAEARQQRDDLAAELATANQQLADAERRAAELAEIREDLDSELTTLRRQLTDAERRGAEAREQQEALSAELAEARESFSTELAETREALGSELAEVREALAAELANLNRQLAGAERRAAEVREEHEALNVELSTVRGQLADTEQRGAEARESFSTELADLRQQLADAERRGAELAETRQDLTAELAETRQDHATELAETRRDLNAELTAVRQQLTEAERRGMELAEAREARGVELAAVHRQLASAERQGAELAHELGASREDLAQVHSSRSWRLVSGYWRSVDFLFPPSSRRRRLYERLTGRLSS